MNKFFIYVIATVFLFLGIGFVSAVCTTPTEDMTVTVGNNDTLCTNTYYGNDINHNGFIIINADGVNFNCNGSTIIGNVSSVNYSQSRGINSVKSGYNITGCTLINWSIGVRADNPNMSRIFNNSFIEMLNYSIYMRYRNNVNIYNNYFYMNDSTRTGIPAQNAYNHINIQYGTGYNIFNNVFVGGYMQVYPFMSNNSNISNNFFYNSTQNGIFEDRGNNGIFNSNYFWGMMHNSIDLSGNNHQTNYNVVVNNGHNAIDLYKDTYTYTNASINYNNISDSFCAAIYFLSYNNSQAVGNIINNISGITDTLEGNCSGTVIMGIQVTANSTLGQNVLIENNSINNIHDFNGAYKVCSFVQTYNTTYKNNKQTNCGNYTYLTGKQEATGSPILNIYGYDNPDNNQSINVYSSNGNNVSFFGLVSPYNDVFNVSTSTVLAYNQTNYNISLVPNQQIMIGNDCNFDLDCTELNCSIGLGNFSIDYASGTLTLLNQIYDGCYMKANYTYGSRVTQNMMMGTISSSFSSLTLIGSFIPLLVIIFVIGFVLFTIMKSTGLNQNNGGGAL